MVILSFFDISFGFWSTKKLIRLGLHVSPRTLWLDLEAAKIIDYRFEQEQKLICSKIMG